MYEVYGSENYLHKSAQAANYGTAGFIVSTLGYLVLYKFFGIPGLLAATVLAYGVCALFALGLKKEDSHKAETVTRPPIVQLLGILRQKKALGLMALSAVFTVASILINFFYVDKLMACGLSEGWLSPIILLDSLLGMLAKPILDRLKNAPKAAVLGISCTIAAGALMAFGRAEEPLPVVALMLILPLLLSIPAFFLGEQQNAFIDEFSAGENRVACLSVMNMGVGLVEILALFASALLTGLGVGICFLAAGLALLIGGLCFLLKP